MNLFLCGTTSPLGWQPSQMFCVVPKSGGFRLCHSGCPLGCSFGSDQLTNLFHVPVEFRTALVRGAGTDRTFSGRAGLALLPVSAVVPLLAPNASVEGCLVFGLLGLLGLSSYTTRTIFERETS